MVVDFIDMRSMKHRKDVEKALREAMKDDRAKFTVGRISSNGLLEINRQRIKKELKLRTHRQCPTCGGAGSIASPELIGLNLLRRMETRAVTGHLKRARVSLHPELADSVQNEYREQLASLEREFDIRIEIIAAPGLHRSEEKIEWFDREQERVEPTPADAAVTVADLATGAGGSPPRRKDSEPEVPDKKASHNGEAGRAGEPEKSRRRRRGGRRRKKSAAGAAEATAAPEPAKHDDSAEHPPEAPPSDEEPAPKRRPRRRRRRKPAAEESGN